MMRNLLIAAVSICAGTLLTLLYAFVATQLWAWFILPLGDSIPVLGLLHAAGLMVFLATVYPKELGQAKDKDQSTLDLLVSVISLFIRPLFLWLMGYCIYVCM